MTGGAMKNCGTRIKGRKVVMQAEGGEGKELGRVGEWIIGKVVN